MTRGIESKLMKAITMDMKYYLCNSIIICSKKKTYF